MSRYGSFSLLGLTSEMSITFRLFPPSVETSGRANWSAVDVTAGPKPLMYFNREPHRLSVGELWLDNTDTGESLGTDIFNLYSLLEEGDDGTPPLLLATWGDRGLQCVLEELTVEEQVFAPTGEPLRARVSLTLLEVQDRREKTSVRVIDDEEPTGRTVFGPPQ